MDSLCLSFAVDPKNIQKHKKVIGNIVGEQNILRPVLHAFLVLLLEALFNLRSIFFIISHCVKYRNLT